MYAAAGYSAGRGELRVDETRDQRCQGPYWQSPPAVWGSFLGRSLFVAILCQSYLCIIWFASRYRNKKPRSYKVSLTIYLSLTFIAINCFVVCMCFYALGFMVRRGGDFRKCCVASRSGQNGNKAIAGATSEAFLGVCTVDIPLSDCYQRWLHGSMFAVYVCVKIKELEQQRKIDEAAKRIQQLMSQKSTTSVRIVIGLWK